MTRRFRYKDIQLPQLRSFCVAATEGNFTAAARLLGLSAPTVWEQVRGLERTLGATLMLRRGRVVELTPEGHVLLNLIQPHVNGLDSLKRLFEVHRSALAQHLTIASTPYLLVHHLVGPVREFAEAYSAVCINVRPSTRLEDSIRLVEKGQADLGVMSYHPEEPLSPHLEYERLFDMHLMLMTASDHPLANKKVVRPQDLVQFPLIMQQEGTRSRTALEGILRRHDLTGRIHAVMESSHFDVIRTYVEAGIGIAVLYTGPNLNRSMPGVHLRVFDSRREGLPVGLMVRKGAHLTEPVEAFRQFVRHALADGVV